MRTSFLPRRPAVLNALIVLFALSINPFPASAADPAAATETTPSKAFGRTPQGDKVTLYTLTNKNGMTVTVMDYGATLVNLLVPDRNGKLDDIALGSNRFVPYLHQTSYFGATVGRYANRIADGRFKIGSVTYQLPRNNGPNTLHGGVRGFDKRMWKMEEVDSNSPAVRFSRLSPDGEEGFPGNVFVSVTYTLTEDNHLRISYQATSDKPTVINLSHHTYFNLAGAGNGTVLDHILTLDADAFTPVDANLIPTGEIKNVSGTPWDFRSPTPMGLHLKETGGNPAGYDHNFVLNKPFYTSWALAATVEEPKTGRTMKVYTDQPGVQFYTGNFLDGSFMGKDGKRYRQYGGFCLETQHYPDSPNHNNFPSTLLTPGQPFRSTTDFVFGVK